MGLDDGNMWYILLLAGIAGVMFATCFMQSPIMWSGEHSTALPATRKCSFFRGLLGCLAMHSLVVASHIVVNIPFTVHGLQQIVSILIARFQHISNNHDFENK